ncbi:MAG: [FeFe] hydrogenase H-cluster radical SAM maturase HydG [Defluviitaleaceae bacterium]|nr:[FeFe] hydrogenase H-cluster radical SAM maturase HydG [Defluviitaleaceae bacterium]
MIDNGLIEKILEAAADVSAAAVDDIIAKAGGFGGLTLEEVAALLVAASAEQKARILQVAGQVKERIYGNRIVLFAPLYISDYCVNNCAYCGFRQECKRPRFKLSQEELRAEVKVLERMGHKRLALEAGEDPENCPLDYVLECIDTVYSLKFGSGDIRRVNVNVAAMDVGGYKRLKDAAIGTYVLFQETYHRPTYENSHKSGPKADYGYHLTAFDRAMEAGIEDVGAGVLFGLYDHKFEVLALMMHNQHLEQRFGVGFHTVSVPRIRAGGGAAKYPHAVNDEDFLQLMAVLRLAMPFVGMIVSTREEPEMRKQLVQAGISQMSAGSVTSVGGYSGGTTGDEQFKLADHRAAGEIIYWLMEEGILPSFCTACYRSGRSGTQFMNLAKGGDIKNVCIPNGLLTLKEYALDYGDARFKQLADKLIEKNINKLENKKWIKSKLVALKNGERDVFV